MKDAPIYHICAEDAWRAAAATGRYEGSELDRADGFIHCSAADAVEDTANLFFAGRGDLVLLVIDPARVDGRVTWDPAPDRPEVLFPHVHGTIPVEAVEGVHPLAPDRDGTFRLPPSRGGLLPL